MQPEKILNAEWKRQAHGKITNLYMTPDGSFIVAGSEDHDVYFIEYSGKILWTHTTGDDVVFCKCSDDGEFTVSYSKDNIVSFFSHRGEQLWTSRIGKHVNSVDMAPDGSFVVVGADDNMLRAFDLHGKEIWARAFRMPITSVSVASGGSLVLAGMADGKVCMLTRDGQIRWESSLGSPVLYVYTSFDGELSYVLETMNNTLHCFSDRGFELCSNTYSQRITDISITEDGRYIAIGFVNSYVYLIDKNLHQVWRQMVPGPVERIKIASDASLITATTGSKSIYVMNKKGDTLLVYLFDAIAKGLDCNTNGEYIVAGALDTIFLFSIGRYLQYLAREQVKILKLMEADRLKSLQGGNVTPGKNTSPRIGGPVEDVNLCRRCGEPILSGRMFCNYCEMMNRRKP